MTRYRCVEDQKAAGFAVNAACEANGVSTSGYYDWVEREQADPTERQVEEAHLVELTTKDRGHDYAPPSDTRRERLAGGSGRGERLDD